jgi:hypothetical protein
MQNLGLYSALGAFEQRRIFIVLHLLWHGASVFPVSSEGSPHSGASYDTWNCWGPIPTWILTGPHSITSYNTQRDAENLFLTRIRSGMIDIETVL